MTMTISNYYSGQRATDRGTKIVDSNGGLDKNAFLQILSAELSNLDPSGDIDSTQYVSQMAQFASLEQTNNLTEVMTTNSNYSLVGKGVTMKNLDSKGNPYTGIISAVTKTTNGAMISVEINVDGKNEYKDFMVSDIDTVIEVPNYTVPSINNLNTNISFLSASNLMNKTVELSEKDSYIQGKVVGVSREGGEVKVKLQLQGSDEVKEYSYDKINKVLPDKVDKIENDKVAL